MIGTLKKPHPLDAGVYKVPDGILSRMIIS
jgi:hypothetical protein